MTEGVAEFRLLALTRAASFVGVAIFPCVVVVVLLQFECPFSCTFEKEAGVESGASTAASAFPKIESTISPPLTARIESRESLN